MTIPDMSELSVVEIGEAILEHHGVKGMKWGQRQSTRKLERADRKWQRNIYSTRGAVALHNETANLVNKNLISLNSNKKYKDKDLNELKNKKLKDEYHRDYKHLVMTAYTLSAEKVHGKSPSGKKEAVYTVDKYGNDRISILNVEAKHANEQEENLVFELQLDNFGKVEQVALIKKELRQSNIIDLAEEILEHHGVKGMKWGVHRDGTVGPGEAKTGKLPRKTSDVTARQKPGQFVRTAGGNRQVADPDAIKVAVSRQYAKRSTTDVLSTKQLQDAVFRMNMEQQYHKLVKQTDRRSRGQKFIQNLPGFRKKAIEIKNNPLTKNVGDTIAKNFAKSAAKKTVKAIALT